MPYIDKGAREDLEKKISMPSSAGELNYTFTRTIQKYLDMKGESYQTYNDLIGALECCKLELYRRRIAEYESKKCWENGDVWEKPEREVSLTAWSGIYHDAMGNPIKR